MTFISTEIPTQYEPLLNNRFEVILPEEMAIDPWLIQSITKPKFTVNKWENFIIEILCVVGPNPTRSISKFLDTYTGEKYFTFFINDLDPTGVTVNTWTITVDEIVLIDFGNCNYSDNSQQIIKMILKPKYCTCR